MAPNGQTETQVSPPQATYFANERSTIKQRGRSAILGPLIVKSIFHPIHTVTTDHCRTSFGVCICDAHNLCQGIDYLRSAAHAYSHRRLTLQYSFCRPLAAGKPSPTAIESWQGLFDALQARILFYIENARSNRQHKGERQTDCKHENNRRYHRQPPDVRASLTSRSSSSLITKRNSQRL